MLSCKDVLFSCHSVPACFAEDTASSTECWYALNADTAAVTPAATRISGFAINVAHKPDNAPDKENVDAAAAPSAVDKPIAATDACASALLIPWFVRIAALCASVKAVLDRTSLVCDSDNPCVNVNNLWKESSGIFTALLRFKAFPRFESSRNAATICWIAYTPPAAPSPAMADWTRLMLFAKSTRLLEPSRKPEYKSLDTVDVAKFSRLTFSALVFASSEVR